MSDASNLNHILGVSRETIERLQLYEALLKKWTRKINLISPKTVPDIWHRHIEDSAQVLKSAPRNWRSWVDLGSGGGLPGIVVAIIDNQNRPVTLIESDTRKSLFLDTVRRELNLNVTVINDRIENVKSVNADVVSARALSNLSQLFAFSQLHSSEKATMLFQKGATYQEELDLAEKDWHFEYVIHSSATNKDACILKISELSRREP